MESTFITCDLSLTGFIPEIKGKKENQQLPNKHKEIVALIDC
jgi:hypothetical protein